MTPSRRRSALARVGGLLVAAALLAGCPDRRVAAPSDALTDPDAVLATMRERLEGLTSLAVEARVSYYSDAGARKGKMTLLARRPASLHFAALSPTDDLLGVLASDGTTFTSFERGGQVCQTGPACPQNVGRMLPLVMEGADVVTVLMGGAPVIRHASSEVEWDARVGAYKVTLSGQGSEVQRLWIEHGTGLVRRADLTRDGKREYELVIDEPQTVAGVRMPGALHATMTRGDVDLRIVYREVDLNLTLEDDAFQLACPQGMQVQRLPCDGGVVPAGAP